MTNITIKQFLHDAKVQLLSVTLEASLEAEILLAHVLNQPRSFLHTWPESILTNAQAKQLAGFMERRLNKEPIAYIVGHHEFWSLDLLVTPETLIPRPETELLVESVLSKLGDQTSDIKIADLGTGSGAIGLALASERPLWKIFATDISAKTLTIARENAKRLALQNISFYQGHWCSALPCRDFNVIVSNPPYIAEAEWHGYSTHLAFEPRHALLSGRDGLDAIQEITQLSRNYLRLSGYLLIEHGFLQGLAVRELFAKAGFSDICTLRDLSNQERVTLGCYC